MTREVRLMIGAVVALACVIVGQQVYIHTRPRPVALLDYPAQRVLSSIPGIRGAAVRVDSDLDVEGIKCNNGPRPLRISGAVSWVSMVPPGTVIQTGQGQATRARGCQAFRFRNPIPPPVEARARQLAAELGTQCTTWRLTGREVPDDPMVLTVSWETEPFQVCV